MCELQGSGNGCRAPLGCKLKVDISVPWGTSKPRSLQMTEVTGCFCEDWGHAARGEVASLPPYLNFPEPLPWLPVGQLGSVCARESVPVGGGCELFSVNHFLHFCVEAL